MSKEVACGPICFMIDYIEGKGIPFETWHQGISYNIEHLQNIHERVEWSVLCRLFKNIKPYFTDDKFLKMGEEMPKRKFNRASRVVIKLLYTRVGLLRLTRDYMSKAIDQNFYCFDVKFEGIGENGVRQIVTLKDKYEFCREFCIMVHGTQICLVNFLGHKNFETNLKLTQRGCIIEIECPKRKPILAQVKDLILFPFTARAAATELEEAHDNLLKRYQEVEKGKLELQKQATQLKTAYEISHVIHKGLNLEDTVQSIAQALVEIAEFNAAQVKVDTDSEGNPIRIEKKFGTVPKNIQAFIEPIIISDIRIGEVKVWISEQAYSADAREIFNRVLPIINMTVDDVLTHRAVIDYQTNLEKKVEQRTIELREARDDLTETVELLKKAKGARDRFFANISHEFRTPLTLILGPANKLLNEEKDSSKRDELKLIHRSANRLYELVNQLLDLSKLESGKMKLKTKPVNVNLLFKELVLSFIPYAERKKIALRFVPTRKQLIAYFDRDKIEKIITNILSNSFKFTAENGEVIVKVKSSSFPSSIKEELKEDSVEISISDTGIGIPEDRIDKIFYRFYQVDGSQTREQEGTGIGLALTKELVELHKGEIEVDSKEGEGTTFTIRLPLGKDHLKPDEFCESEEMIFEEREKLIFDNSILASIQKVDKTDIGSISEEDKPLLLIIEDNADVLYYMKGFLIDEYKIFEAVDGEDGLKKSLKYIPDIIISDIMMPKMDGFELCEKLKTDERTSHIPIILLTAKATSKDKIEGYEVGADDYIMKPFDANVLKVRVKNLIEQRKKLREHFRKEGLFNLESEHLNTVDRSFLQRVNNIISKNLSDASFGVEAFANEIALSRVTLHKKLVALVDESPGELIKRIRLNKAAKHIEHRTGNLSEIALEVGFNNPGHFSEAFKKQFGVTPSQYRHNFTNN